MLLKQPEDSNLNLPVWDPRVSMPLVFHSHMFSVVICRPKKRHPYIVDLLNYEFVRVDFLKLSPTDKCTGTFVFLLFHVSSFILSLRDWENLIVF